MPFIHPAMQTLALSLAGLRFSGLPELVLTLVLLIPLAFFGACALYLWGLLLAAIPLRRRLALLQRPQPAGNSPAVFPVAATTTDERPRFTLLIPAHNEALLLGAALDTLQTLQYPRDRYTIVVIADNCTDATAQIARQHGAVALERHDTTRIGKGYALEWALEQLLAAPHALSQAKTTSLSMETPAFSAASASSSPATSADNKVGTDADLDIAAQFDAVVILDADTFVAPNLLAAFAQAFARGDKAMQARYEVLNEGDSWRTKLMSCALALAHIVKPLGRERRQLSDGLKGNGMAFAHEVVQTVPWSGESITEDIEYTLRLCRAGYRIAFLPDTAVWAQMPVNAAQATNQRRRWEGGRYHLLTRVAPQLLGEGIRSRSRLLRDRAIELIIPPFAEMFALPVALLLVSLLLGWLLHGPLLLLLAALWSVVLLLQVGYLLGGMWVARVPASVALSLFYAPFYVVWKFGLYGVMLATRSIGGWNRTERHEL